MLGFAPDGTIQAILGKPGIPAAPSAPVNTVAPVVSGPITVGSTLTVANGSWTGVPTPTFTYQWKRGGVSIGGATASTYMLTSAEIGALVSVVVTGTNGSGSASGNSNSVGPISSGSTNVVYYVAAAGSDANDGLTTATPWQTTTKVASVPLNAGDTVSFNGGDTFAGTLNVTRAGTNVSRILYNSYGVGKAILSGIIQSYNVAGGWVFDSLTANGGMYFGGDTGSGANVTVQNCALAGPLPFGGDGAGFGWSNILVTNNTFTAGGVSGYVANNTDALARIHNGWTITNNVISNGAVGVQLGGVQNFTVTGNTITGTADTAGIWCYDAANGVISGNSVSAVVPISGQSNNGNGCMVSYDCVNIVVERNLTFNNTGAGIMVLSSAGPNNGVVSGVVVRNNILINDCGGATISASIVLGSGAAPLSVTGSVHNNTVYQSRAGKYCHSNGAATINVGVVNNVFVTAGTAAGYIISGSVPAVLFNGNVYFGSATLVRWNGINYATVAAWRAAIPAQETLAGVDTSIIGDPKFLNAGTTVAGDYNLLPDTAAGAGVLLSAVTPPITAPATDYFGSPYAARSAGFAAPYVLVWSYDFTKGVSFRTGGLNYWTGYTTGYNDPTAVGTWAINPENYMNTSKGFGDFGYGFFLNAVSYPYYNSDATFPAYGMIDPTDAGVAIKGSEAYPAVRALLPTIAGGHAPFISSIIGTTQSMKVKLPYIRRFRFKLNSMGRNDFPANWGEGERYNANPAYTHHYEIDDFERFGADNPDTMTAQSAHIFSPSTGTNVSVGSARYNMASPVGPNVQMETVVVHRADAIHYYTNGVHTAQTAPPSDADLTDFHHVLINMAVGLSWERYPGVFLGTVNSGSNVMTATSVDASTRLAVGQTITGTAFIPAGTTILSFGTGTGTTGTYTLSANATGTYTGGALYNGQSVGFPSMTVQSVEVFKPALDPTDVIPPAEPIPVVTWNPTYVSGADAIVPSTVPDGTTIATVSGAGAGGTYALVPYNNALSGVVLSGTNLNKNGTLAAGSFYLKVVNAAGWPRTGPKRSIAVTTGPVNTVAPAVSGSVAVGATLTTTTGTWTGTPTITYAYQWNRGGVAISAATATTYVTVAADVGAIITATVTATNTAGVTSATSAGVGPVTGVAPVNTAVPVISGSTSVGATLTTTDGTWTGIPAPTFAYQWKRGGVNIAGAVSNNYTLVSADSGTTITATVTGTNLAGNAAVTAAGVGPIGGAALDATPAPYRTTTQTMIAGMVQTCVDGMVPKLESEFSINVWWRQITGVEGFVFNFWDPAITAVGAPAIGGTTFQAICLYYSGATSATLSDNYRFALTGMDKAGNKFSPSTIAVRVYGNGYGYFSADTQPNTGALGALLTVQYRSGNIELWMTSRGMAPRLLIQQACTWTGTTGPLPWRVGGSNTSANAPGTIELEMPIVLPDRSLSQNEIAQLADGMSPETLNVAAGKASGSLKFGIVTNGGSTIADRIDSSGPADGNTITLNGTVYTFRLAPTLTTDLKIYNDITINQSYVTDGTFTFASAPPVFPVNGQHVALARTTMPNTVNTRFSYYVVNANSGANTYQLSATPGGAALTISVGASSATTRMSFVPQLVDDLATQLNALTPNTGGASNATYSGYGSDTLIIISRTAGSGGTAFTFDCNATNVKMPTNKRLALAWVYITDYLNFNVGLLADAGQLRRRSAAWATPTGGELAPNTQVTGSVRVNSWTNGMVTNSVGGVSYLAMSGIYTGVDPSSGAQLKLYDLNGGTMVQDFTSFTSFSYNNTLKTWTGKLTAPVGKRWLACEQRKVGGSQVTHRSEVRFGMGYVVLLHGRSHQTDWCNTYTGNDIVPNGFISQFNGTGMTLGANGYFSIDNCWHVYDTALHCGSGATVFGNLVGNAKSACVGFISRAVGGVAFSVLNTPAMWAGFQNDLLTTWADTSLMPATAAMIWTHAGEDYMTPIDVLSTLRANLTSYIGVTTMLGVTSSFSAGDSPDGSEFLSRVQGEQNDYKAARLAASDTTVFDAGRYLYDRINTVDGVHSTSINDTKVKCETAAIGFLGALSGVMNAAAGPTIASIVRTGANLDITWNLNGATGLQLVNPGVSISAFDVARASSNFLPLTNFVTPDFTTDIFTQTAHGWSNGDPIIITSATQPAGITTGVTYYLINATANTYQLSATVGGAAINYTSNGSGVHAWNIRDLLIQTSHTITGANTTRIVLSANPGASVLVMHQFGRPGKQIAGSFDPNYAGDPTGRAAMTQLWGPVAPAGAQGNVLNDNTARSYTSTTTIGRLACQTSTYITVP